MMSRPLTAELEPVTEASTPSPSERAATVALVRRYAGSATDAILDPATKIFTSPGIKGLIGYRVESGNAIIFGDPAAPSSDKQKLALAFDQFTKENGLTVIYIAASEEFAKWAIHRICSVMVEFGNELTIDPQDDPREKTGTRGSLVRRKVRHAQNEGVAVHEYTGNDKELEKSIEQVGEKWLKARKGPQIHISNVLLFMDREGKRWFYAKKGNKIIGVVVINRLEAYQGDLMNHLMITSDAPNGTPELLVVTALEALAHEDCHYVTFGTAPATRLGDIQGISPFSAGIARLIFKLARLIFRLDSHKFWEKFHPNSSRCFLLLSKGIGLNELRSIKGALK